MDPKTYCAQTLQAWRGATAPQGDPIDRTQVKILLAHYAQHTPPAADFARDLAGLARSAEQTGRRTLAKAARELLEDWQTQAGGSGTNDA